MKTSPWTVAPTGPAACTMAGPGLDDLAHYVLDGLAESIHHGDGRAQAWTDYVIVRGRLAAAVENGVTGAALERLEDAVADAWDALAPEFAATVRLGIAEARLVAMQLDEAAGRIGSVAA